MRPPPDPLKGTDMKMFKRMKALRIAAQSAAAMLALTAAAGAWAEDKQPQQTQAAELPARVESIATRKVQVPLALLDWVDATGGLALSGASPKRSAYFAVKRDELVTDGEFELFFTPSPALIPVRSQLNVYLNGFLQKSIPITQESLGNLTSEKVKLDPRVFKDSNIFDFELIGHYTDHCENPVDSTIWLNLSAQSRMNLSKQQLDIANDLAFFPLPFFNTSTNQKSVLSVIFPKVPDDRMLTAAAVLASYGGVLTKWRGADYPVYIDDLPASGNAVVFMTNDARPYFLKNYPEVQVPTVEMMDVPGNSVDKLLVISAPDGEGLEQAVKALALGSILFNGPVSQVLEFKEIEKRRPYDAPNWVNTDRKFTIGSLTTLDNQLSSQGFAPPPIDVSLNLPPDLFFVNGSRIDINLMYKYSKPQKTGLSQLRFIINDHLIRSYPLDPDEESDVIKANLPLIGSLNVLGRTQLDTSFLKPQNTLSFDFRYSMVFSSKLNECITTLPIPNRVEIDPASTFDFSGLYHFTKMPNLNLFWQSGYPFSIYADLQNTAAVIADPADTSEITALLNIVGRIGSQLGHPGTALSVFSRFKSSDSDQVKDKDLLIFGEIPEALRNDDNAKVVLTSTEQAISTSFNDTSSPGKLDEDVHEVAQHVSTQNFQGVGAMVSYRSPLDPKHTVVALFADSPFGMANLNDQMVVSQSEISPSGSISVLKADQSRSYEVGESYYNGDLPWYQRIYYLLLDSPWVLMFLCLFCCVVFCALCFRALKALQRRRLERNSQRSAQ